MEYITRELERKFLKLNDFFKVILVAGARQIGKTMIRCRLRVCFIPLNSEGAYPSPSSVRIMELESKKPRSVRAMRSPSACSSPALCSGAARRSRRV